MPKHIGIIGVSPEGSSICYRMIGRRASEIEKSDHRPSVTLHNRPFSNYVAMIKAGDWEGVAEHLAASAHVLNGADCDFCILPDNVSHYALPMAQAKSPLPILNMIELVADAIETNGCREIGLIGTKYVTFGSTYQTLLGLRGIKLHVPNDADAETIDRIIFTEAVYGSVRDQSVNMVADVMARLKEKGAEAVVLGASEASLMLAGALLPLPLFDPIELLAEAAIAHALREVEVA